jgi:predicted RNA binding protein YcfA (HicA-like mRNA interferase family)
MKVSDIITIITKDGWFEVRQRGSHKQYKHSVKKGLVTVAFHKMSDDVALGTLDSILKQAQIKIKR